VERASLGRVAVEVDDLDVVARDAHDLVLAELDRVAGVGDEGGDVGREEVLAVADAHDERGVAAGGDDLVGRDGVDRDQRERALEAADHGAHGLDEVGAQIELAAQQVRGDLGVGVGGELLAAQVGAQRQMVLDDAVVHDGDAAGDVRVRVGVGRAAVRRPAGVADRHGRRRQRVVGQVPIQVGDPARPLAPLDVPVHGDRDARGVVPAVLHPAEPAHHDLQPLALTQISDDSTHSLKPYRTSERFLTLTPTTLRHPGPLGRLPHKAPGRYASGVIHT